MPGVDNGNKKRSRVLAVLTVFLFCLHLALSIRAVLTVSRNHVHPTAEWFFLSIIGATVLLSLISGAAWASNAGRTGAALPLSASSIFGVVICLLLFGL